MRATVFVGYINMSQHLAVTTMKIMKAEIQISTKQRTHFSAHVSRRWQQGLYSSVTPPPPVLALPLCSAVLRSRVQRCCRCGRLEQTDCLVLNAAAGEDNNILTDTADDNDTSLDTSQCKLFVPLSFLFCPSLSFIHSWEVLLFILYDSSLPVVDVSKSYHRLTLYVQWVYASFHSGTSS